MKLRLYRQKIEGLRCVTFEINNILKHVENIFTCKIRCGSCGYIAGDVETPTSVFSSDYTHVIIGLKKLVSSRLHFPHLPVAMATSTGLQPSRTGQPATPSPHGTSPTGKWQASHNAHTAAKQVL